MGFLFFILKKAEFASVSKSIGNSKVIFSQRPREVGLIPRGFVPVLRKTVFNFPAPPKASASWRASSPTEHGELLLCVPTSDGGLEEERGNRNKQAEAFLAKSLLQLCFSSVGGVAEPPWFSWSSAVLTLPPPVLCPKSRSQGWLRAKAGRCWGARGVGAASTGRWPQPVAQVAQPGRGHRCCWGREIWG